jgi:hypothetical protein
MRDQVTEERASAVIEEIGRIVAEAVEADKQYYHPGICNFPDVDRKGAALALRKRYGAYFKKLTLLVRDTDETAIGMVTALVDRFYHGTWLRHILDAAHEAYVLSDYLSEMATTIERKGGKPSGAPGDQGSYLLRQYHRYLESAWKRLDEGEDPQVVPLETLREVLAESLQDDR